jgi:hypothetical protein
MLAGYTKFMLTNRPAGKLMMRIRVQCKDVTLLDF